MSLVKTKQFFFLLGGLLLALAVGADNASTEGATFSLADATFELDFVLCYAETDGSVRIALADDAARDEYPFIGIWLRADQPEAAKPQVFSVDFNRTAPRMKWRFKSGEYEKTAAGFRASGQMDGTRLSDKPGERSMTPLGDDADRPFTLEVVCNAY